VIRNLLELGLYFGQPLLLDVTGLDHERRAYVERRAKVALPFIAKIETAEELDLTRERLARAEAERDGARNRVAEALRAKDGAYSERDRLVCALSKMFPSWLARHPDSDASWDDDWRWIVFVQLPTGQASWHIHDSERGWFDHLSVGANSWDGHTNDEKYARLAKLTAAKAELRVGEGST
jgi:hypothetical protein